MNNFPNSKLSLIYLYDFDNEYCKSFATKGKCEDTYKTNEVMIMTEDKNTLKEWLIDMKTLIDQSKELSSQIEGYQRAIKALELEQLENSSKREEHVHKILGRSGSDEEALNFLENELQERYRKDMRETIENSSEQKVYKVLSSWTKTTKVMDSFYHSENKFLILYGVYQFEIWKPSYTWVDVSLIISKSVDCPKVEESCPTLTEIKRISSLKRRINANGRVLAHVPERMMPLTSEVLSTINNEGTIENGKTITFKVPFKIGGQTYDDQTGYGSYYEGDDCIYEGTYYGQTTSFYVVGIILNMR